MSLDKQFQTALNTGNTSEAIRLGKLIMEESLQTQPLVKPINTIAADNATKFTQRSKTLERLILIRGERMMADRGIF